MLKISVKVFDDLNTKELYKILQLRSEVFVVEQNCVYQDLDGKDKKAIHVLGYSKNKLVAYTRLFKPLDYFKEASIGRIVVKENERQNGIGAEIIKASIRTIETKYGTQQIRISAQTYLIKYYNRLGFKEVGEEYLEDGIPHINMVKS